MTRQQLIDPEHISQRRPSGKADEGCSEEPECKCWVATRPEVERFGIRYGAHGKACPQYRESLDPVDRANDEELRGRFEGHCESERCREVCECNCDPCLMENVIAN